MEQGLGGLVKSYQVIESQNLQHPESTWHMKEEEEMISILMFEIYQYAQSMKTPLELKKKRASYEYP